MHYSDLFLVGAKKAIPDVLSSNWHWLVIRFNIVDLLYIVQFRESSSIKMRRFLKHLAEFLY